MKILPQSLPTILCALCFCLTSTLQAQELSPQATLQQERWLDALRDDGIVGNCGPAYHSLLKSEATHILQSGLESTDWQQRLLSAVIFAQSEVPVEQLDLVCRILIWHLEENSIRGDALVAENALVVLGEITHPWLRAAQWHRDGPFAIRVRSVMGSIKRSGRRKDFLARSKAALANWTPSLDFLGEEEIILGLSVPIPTHKQRMEQFLFDLKDDNLKGNAVEVFDELRFAVYTRGTAMEVLWQGLLESDRQQRVLTASLLIHMQVEPRPALFQVAVECLEQDLFGSPRTLNVGNANLAYHFLMQYPERSPWYLLPALESPDLTPKLRAAAILAQLRYSETQRYVPLLLERLQDNRFPEDAVLAGQSLALLGPSALPWLEQVPVDSQQAFYFHVIRKAIALREADPQARLPFSNAGMYRLEN